MPRQLKPQLVTELRHESRIVVPIMFDRNDLTFFAEYGEHKVSAASADEVKEQMREYLTAMTVYKWLPVIQVSTGNSFDSDTLHVTSERYHVAKFADGRWRRLNWGDLDPEPNEAWGEPTVEAARIRRSRDAWSGIDYSSLPSRQDERRSFAYDENLWLALKKIENGITAMRDKLNELLNTDTGVKKLQSVGAQLQKLLPQ